MSPQLVLLHRLYHEAETPPTPSSCGGRVAALRPLPLLPLPLPPPHGAGHSRALHHSTQDGQGVHRGERELGFQSSVSRNLLAFLPDSSHAIGTATSNKLLSQYLCTRAHKTGGLGMSM